MEDQATWRLRYLEARVEAADRADEVLALLLAAEDTDQVVAELSTLLRLDERGARGVLDNWGAHLTQKDRAEAVRALAAFKAESDPGACR